MTTTPLQRRYGISLAFNLTGVTIGLLALICLAQDYASPPVLWWLRFAVVLACTIFNGVCVWHTITVPRRQKHRAAARERGKQLLLRLLTPAQRQQYSVGAPIKVPVRIGGEHIGDAYLMHNHGHVVWCPFAEHHDKLPYHGGQCVYLARPKSLWPLYPEDDLIAKLLWCRTDPLGLIAVSPYH